MPSDNELARTLLQPTPLVVLSAPYRRRVGVLQKAGRVGEVSDGVVKWIGEPDDSFLIDDMYGEIMTWAFPQVNAGCVDWETWPFDAALIPAAKSCLRRAFPESPALDQLSLWESK